MTAHLVRLPRGASIDGWRVLGELGNGGFAFVLLVEKNGERRALKVARHREASGDEKQTHARLKRELTIVSMLDHPNIVRLRGHGDAEAGNFYLALEYVDGWTLGEWQERKHPTVREILSVFAKVASALAYMHGRGILHRDLKLSNVLIRKSDGEPVIIDFSCATYSQAEELTESGLPPGTDRFRAPEQFKFLREHREEHRARYAFQVADEVFAFGAMLYELLTDPRPTENRQRHPLNNPLAAPPPARALNERVPEALSDLVESILSRDPARRPVDTEALQRELSELLADPGAEYLAPAHPPSEQRKPGATGGGQLAHGGRSLRVLAAGAGVALLLAAGVALWFFPRVAPAPPAETRAAGRLPPPSADPAGPPVAAAPALSPAAPAPVVEAGSAHPAIEKEGSSVKRQPTEAPKQARTLRSPKALPSVDVCKALPLAAALAAGCTGVPVRPEPFTCPEGAVRAMQELGWGRIERFSVYTDDRHEAGDVWFNSGDTIVAVVPPGVVASQAKKAPPGTRFLGGKVYVDPKRPSLDDPRFKGTVYVRYDRVKLPKGDELPACFVVEIGAVEVKDSAAKGRNNASGVAVTYWP
ncbi:serine/threonine-protein kinase [Myxococcaceae bacterium GXIMD 01537]